MERDSSPSFRRRPESSDLKDGIGCPYNYGLISNKKNPAGNWKENVPSLSARAILDETSPLSKPKFDSPGRTKFLPRFIHRRYGFILET